MDRTCEHLRATSIEVSLLIVDKASVMWRCKMDCGSVSILLGPKSVPSDGSQHFYVGWDWKQATQSLTGVSSTYDL